MADAYPAAVRAGARPATSREIVARLQAAGLRRRKVSRLAREGSSEPAMPKQDAADRAMPKQDAADPAMPKQDAADPAMGFGF